MARRWTRDQDRQLKSLYERGAKLGVIADALGRSADAVEVRRRARGIPARPRSRPWTKREEQILRAAHRERLPAAVLAATLSRTTEQVRRRRRALLGPAPPGRPYAAIEDAALRLTFRPGADIAQLAADLGRSPGSVQHRLRKLGLLNPAPRPRWKAHEDAAVRDGYALGLTCEQIATELEGRTPTAVAARAAKLGLATYARRWSAADDLTLKGLARDEVPLERAARILARTPAAVRARARKLGIDAPQRSLAHRARRRWSREEDERLALHAELNPALLAELLQRTPEAVVQRMRRLALRAGSHRSPHHPAPTGGDLSPGERATIARELNAGTPRRRLALARRLQRPPADIPNPLHRAAAE